VLDRRAALSTGRAGGGRYVVAASRLDHLTAGKRVVGQETKVRVQASAWKSDERSLFLASAPDISKPSPTLNNETSSIEMTLLDRLTSSARFVSFGAVQTKGFAGVAFGRAPESL
jgi:hypothetical protein